MPRLEAAFDSTVRVDDVVYEDLRDGVLTVTVTPVGLGSRIAAAESYDGVDVTTAGSVQIRLHLGEENLF